MIQMARLAFGASALAAVMVASAAHAEQKLKLSTNSSPTHWSSVEAFVPFMTCVTDRTKGEITFDFFHSSQLATTTESLSAVTGGIVEVSYLALSALSDKMPVSGISMLPDMGGSATQMAKAFRKVLTDGGPFADEFSRNNVHPLFIIMTPPYQIVMRDNAARTPEDFAGKKLRVSGSALSMVVSSLGGVPVEMPPSEIYLAMQQGVVDGTVLSLPSLAPYSLQEIAGAASMNATLGGATAVLSIDTRIWDALDPGQQDAMTRCGEEVEAHINAFVDGLNASLADEFRATGVDVYALTATELSDISDYLLTVRESYVQRISDRGFPAQEALAQYLATLGE